jgi:integrase/recombinase XerD
MNTYPCITQFKQLVQLKDYRPPTKDAYVRCVWRLAEHFDGDPAQLHEDQLRQYFLFLREEQQYSPSSMKMAKWALRCFYRECLKVTDWSVFEDLRIKEAQPLPVVLCEAEVQRLLHTVREERFAVCLRLIYHCGLRVGEAVSLEVQDILGHHKPPRPHLRNAKGGKDRHVPMAPAMLEELRAFWRTHHNPRLLFPCPPAAQERALWSRSLSQTNVPMSVASVQEVFRMARQASGVHPRATVHTLRHSYATHLLERGISLRQISAYLGHQSLDTTVIYTHLTAVSEARTQAALQALYQPRPS